MFSCACRLTITSPASPPRSSSSFTSGNACTGPCSVPTRERRAAREHERPRAGPALRQTDRTTITSSSQKAANIAIPAPMIRNGCSAVASSACSGVRPRCDDEAALVEAEVERRDVEGERAAEQRVEARCSTSRAATARSPPERGASAKKRTGDEHRQPGDEVDVRVADRVDPLARVAGLVEPVGVRRLHLDHALHGADRQRRGARREELPQVPLRLRHAHEARLEDGHDRRWSRSTSSRAPSRRRPSRSGPCTSCPCAPSPPGSSSRARSAGPSRSRCRPARRRRRASPTAVNQNAHWARPSLASGRPTIRGSTYQQRPVASSVPPPTIITCVFERSRTRWPA